MKLGRREARFVHRVAVLLTGAAAMGIAIVVLKESREIQKIVEPSTFRDILLVFAPFSALSMTGYSLASRSFSSGGLLSELVALSGSYSLFLAVALPSFIKRELNTADDCSFWQIYCEETLSVRDHRITLVFLVLSTVLVSYSLFLAGVIRQDRKE